MRDVHIVQAGDLEQPIRLQARVRSEHAYVSMATEVLQELDLPQGTLGQDFLAKNIGNLLDCHSFTGLHVRGGAENVTSVHSLHVQSFQS